MSDSTSIISLPQGGGALSGIGEKFTPDLHTGTGNFGVPIALPSGRNGFQPELNLVYSTGTGNGPFGLGWGLSVPGVSRKTSRGVPIYDDAQDDFVLSGAEDLVPISGAYPGTVRYRPRTEGLFARIEHIQQPGEDYWTVRSTDGLISRYGTPASAGVDPAVVADPDDRHKLFAWRLTETRDPFGNRIVYDYARDTDVTALRSPGLPAPDARETDFHHWDQLYLHRIRYVDFGDDEGERFLVSVTFEYAEQARPDLFSEHRAGFEIRTRLRCQRIHVRVHEGADGAARPVRTYELVYLDERDDLEGLAERLPLNGVSLLSQMHIVGYDDGGQPWRELPPLEFGYTRFEPLSRKFEPLQGDDLPPLPLNDPGLELVDLFGQGLPDVLQLNGAARYWRNLGDGRFDRPRAMQDAPAGLALGDPGVQLVDADGDGRSDLLLTAPGLAGYFPLQFGGGWDRRSFQRYAHAPSFNLQDPEVKLVDLDGDGVTDAIRSGGALECYFNDPHEGWNETRRVERQALENFPNVPFSDPRVRWADMTGDGLQDIVLVHDGNVEYWPSLGHGRWGQRVHVRNSPRFPTDYDPRRILLGDVDGDGLADLLYVERGKVTLWINRSGNGWSEPLTVRGTPSVTDVDDIRLVDLLGSGVRGLLWSTNATGIERKNLWFLDFTGGLKPYLLFEMDNHIGAVTRVEYAPSTHFYLADQKKPATRWRTPLPFPVHVVARVEVIDALSRGKLTTEYVYHHGYWDGAEREFRGFGMVEQRDTESFDSYAGAGLHPGQPFEAVAPRHFSPPTLTRTWFHQGAVGEEHGEWAELEYDQEYWSGDPQLLDGSAGINAFLADYPQTPESRRVKRDALRALRGSILRSELYALDGDDGPGRPYTVTETAYGLHEVSPPQAGAQRRRVFFPHPIAERTTQWERGDDPLTQFSFTRYAGADGQFDPYGRPLRSTTIACPRGWRAMVDRPAEGYLATRTQTTYARPVDLDIHIHDRVARATTFELTDSGARMVRALAELLEDDAALTVIGQAVNFYDGEAFTGLPFGELGAYGALVRSESLVATEEILRDAYGELPPYLEAQGAPAWAAEYVADFRDALPPLGGYVVRTAAPYAPGYYVRAQQLRYDFQEDPAGRGRGLVTVQRAPLAVAGERDTRIGYDRYGLLPVRVTGPIGLETTAEYDYRVFQPRLVTGANGNRSAYTYTPLGLLESSALLGKGPTEGDRDQPSVRLRYAVREFVESGAAGTPGPIYVHTTSRVFHDTETDVPLPERDDVVEVREYSDGFGRLLQTRALAEDVLFGDLPDGGAVIPADQALYPGDIVGRRRAADEPPNVVVSGWQTYDNKGQVVESYEPFFDRGWDYAPPAAEQFGAKVTMFYDPRGHVVRTVNPDGSEQRVVYGVPGSILNPNLTTPDDFEPTPWEAYTYDANDLAPVSAGPLPDGSSGTLTSRAPAFHHFTPSSVTIDALGRVVESIARNRETPNAPTTPIEEHVTRMVYDVRGNMLAVEDALGRQEAFRYAYDLADRRLRLYSIDAGARTSVLDVVGNLLERRDGRGALVLQTYDLLDRTSRVWARDGATEPMTLRERIVYGDGGRPDQPASERAANRAANRLGRPHRHYDEAGLLTFERYDFKGNLLQKSRRVLPDGAILAGQSGVLDPQAYAALSPYETSMTYDGLDRFKTLTYPQDVTGARRVLRPGYNRAGALERVILDGAVYVHHIAYNARGQRAFIAYGNGVLTGHAYDAHTFRLRRLWSGRFTQPQGVPDTYRPTGAALQDNAYVHDLAGNITALHDRAPESGLPGKPDSLERAFGYDALYRLLSASGRECDLPLARQPWQDGVRCTDVTRTRAYGETYAYDRAGNLTQLRHAAGGDGSFTRRFGLEGGNNRLQRVESGQLGIDYVYDANGNLLQEAASRHFEWDYADRLKRFRTQAGAGEPTVSVHYLYDPSGLRVKKLERNKQGAVVQSTVTIDDVFEHCVHAAAQNNMLHVMDDESRVALLRVGPPLDGDAGPAVQYHLGDHLGSSALVLGGAAAASSGFVSREEYTPYGETSFGSYGRKRYRFSGKERDEESGLYYFGARYYAPWVGRWWSCDPLGASDHLNLYQAFRNNPIKYTDSTGLQSHPDGDLDAGAPPPEVDGGNMIPGGAAKGPDGGAVYEYTPDPERIQKQDDFVKGMKAAVVNSVVDQVGPKAGVEHMERQVTASVPIVGPRLADHLFNPLLQRMEPYYDMLKLEIPASPAGDEGYVAGIFTVNILESLAMSGLGRATSMASKSRASALAEETQTAPRVSEIAVREIVPGFSATETGIIREAQSILGSSEMASIRAAHAAGQSATVRLGGRVIQYEPGMPASGMTMFGENGFIIGREAFVSEAELNKTVLHELHRMTTSSLLEGGAASAKLVASETRAASEFAERAYRQVFPGAR